MHGVYAFSKNEAEPLHDMHAFSTRHSGKMENSSLRVRKLTRSGVC